MRKAVHADWGAGACSAERAVERARCNRSDALQEVGERVQLERRVKLARGACCIDARLGAYQPWGESGARIAPIGRRANEQVRCG